MQQGRISRTLIPRQERDVRDAREALERASDLTPRIDTQRSGAHPVDDDAGGSRPRETT